MTSEDVSVEGGDRSPDPGGLELVRVDADHWRLHDNGYDPDDARSVVAHIREIDEGVDVVWVSTNVPLPTRYRDAGDIVEDLERWRRDSGHRGPPANIASFPPLGANGSPHVG